MGVELVEAACVDCMCGFACAALLSPLLRESRSRVLGLTVWIPFVVCGKKGWRMHR